MNAIFGTELFDLISSIDENTHITADNHFFHEKITQFEPNRLVQMKKDGYEDHEAWLIHLWNSKIGKDDLVLHLGDFAMKGILELVGKLNGKKILILGNHDRKGLQTYNKQFDHVIRGSYVHFNNKLYIAEGNDQLFSSLVLPFRGKTILFSHYPACEEEKKFYIIEDRENADPNYIHRKDLMINRISETIELADENNVDFNIHGHTHSTNYSDDGLMYKLINCSLDNTDFLPVRLGDIIKNDQ